MANYFLRTALFGLACLLLPLYGWGADKPNILYIVADDLGWKDVGFHGGTPRTPTLDKLATGGAMLNAFYVQPSSSQTRAAAITGRYPMRYGLQTGTLTAASAYCLSTEERTLGQALKEAGYGTAFVGKWQLGHAQPECLPNKRGFDHFYGPLTQPADSIIKKTTKTDWRLNDKPAKVEGWVSALLGKYTAGFLASTTQPWFVMLSFSAPAAPYGATKELLDSYSSIKDEPQRRYAAAVTALDQAIGEVVSSLEQRGQLANTLILFHSDSGAAMATKFPTGDGDVEEQGGDNGVFREGRGSLYEGGLRVPALAFWPGKIAPKTVITDPVHVTDFPATLLALAGASADPKKKLDGMDLWSALTGATRSPRKEILLNVEDFHGALRVGEYKLIVHAALPSKVELFRIANDPEEADNVAQRYPDRAKEMLGKLNEYAYDMLPALKLEESSTTKGVAALWRANPARR
ncbi:MAG: sulfatase [Betaproteobacteria bacterium]|nr:sulfatase [Betaproteobacteria bacterium]